MQQGRRLLTIGVGGAVTFLGFAAYKHFSSPSSTLTLSNRDFTALRVSQLKWISPSSFRLSLELPLSIATGFHRDFLDEAKKKKRAFYFEFKDPRIQVTRAYTPIACSGNQLEFVIRTYPWPHGELPRFISQMKPGTDKVEIHGPYVSYEVSEPPTRPFGFIVGGTGIAPAFQMIQQILEDPNDSRSISLIYANRNPDEVLLKSELEDLQKRFPSKKIHIAWTVDQAARDAWQHSIGYVNKAMIEKEMPKPTENPVIFVCGPPGFMEYISGQKGPTNQEQGELRGLLRDMGYSREQVFKF